MNNNPVSIVDPEGDLGFIGAVLIGALINIASQELQGNINSFGDFLGAAAVGAASGAVGFGAGNAWLGGASFGQGLGSGIKGAGLGALTGGAIGGISGGLHATKHGGSFWNGKGATFDIVSSGYQGDGNPVEYSNESARSFADDTFGEVKSLRDLYADGSVPDGYSYDSQTGKMFDELGTQVDGTTRYVGGRGQPSDVYMAKTVFVSRDYLTITMGHEFNHVTLNHNGFMLENHEGANYNWTYEQARILKHPSASNWRMMSKIFKSSKDHIYSKYLIPHVKP